MTVGLTNKVFVGEYSTTTGSGPMTLAGPINDMREIGDAVDDEGLIALSVYLNTGSLLSEFETAIYRYDEGGNTITAVKVFESSNGDAKVSWSAGTKRIMGAALPQMIPIVQDIRRNRMINPSCQISNLNGDTAGTTTAYYPCDEESVHFVTSAGALSIQRIQETSLAGSKDKVRITVSTADASLAAGEYLYDRKPFEGSKMADLLWGTGSAVPVVVRREITAPAGTWAAVIQNAAGDRSYVQTFTVAPGDAGVAKVYEFAFPGCTTGTWPTGDVLWGAFLITFASGSTFQTTAGAWQSGNYLGTSAVTNGLASNTNVFKVTDSGLKADPYGIGVYGQFESRDVAEVERECQRYLPTLVYENGIFAVGHATGTTTLIVPMVFVVPARVKPTGLTYSVVGGATTVAYNAGAGGTATFNLGFGSSGRLGCYISGSSSSGLVAGNATAIGVTGTSAKFCFTGSRL